MSSPIYPGFIEDLSPEDLQNLSEIDAAVSQSSYPVNSLRPSQPGKIHAEGLQTSQPTRDKRRTSEPGSEANNHLVATQVVSTSVQPTSSGGIRSGPSVPATVGFTSVRAIAGNMTNDYCRSPSPEGPPEQDYDSWFDTSSTDIPAFVGFQSASTVNGTGPVGFTSAGNGTSFLPSEAALQGVKKRMRDWEADFEEEFSYIRPPTFQTGVTSPRRPVTPPRPSLDSDKNPTPPTPPSQQISPQHATFTRSAKQKPFKPPLLSNKTNLTNTVPASPSNAAHSKGPVPQFKPPLLSSTSASTLPKPSTPSRTTSDSAFRTPGRLGGVHRPGSAKRFTTPFKPGMRPGEPGRARLQKDQEEKRLQEQQKDQVFQIQMHSPPRKPVYDVAPSLKSPSRSRTEKERAKGHRFFDPTSPPNRKTLATCGKVPQSYSGDELESMGINIAEMRQITPETAIHYSFYSPSGPLGPTAALEALQNAGCTLATEDWVYNHWGLILWKQAGMLCFDPTEARRWSWEETIKQLLHRYERELQGGSRPPFKLIVAGDSPPSSPMVLCVSKVNRMEGQRNPDGTVEDVPELELTDGWYKLRAEVDAPLTRAIRRGAIRVGRKIGVVDAKLVSDRKEPSEILEAYDSVKLSLSGNSTHLAPWHAKLGFRRCASVCTLNSLTSDGGNIAMMKHHIEKVYPVAYLEFVQEEDGKRRRIGPMGEKEEMAARDAWQAKRDTEAVKLRSELEARISTLEGYADRMDVKFGDRFILGEDDTCPEIVEDFYEQLEGFSHSQSIHSQSKAFNVLSGVTAKYAGWLSRIIRENIAKDKEKAKDEIESELNALCPLRNVKDFRVVIARDARTDRKPANRTAQITVWNVMSLAFEEGGDRGDFKVGQTFLVSNLFPNQPGSWMNPSTNADGLVYLATGRRTHWTPCR
ncbi:hypothetical protein BDM02DRAFT_3190371 [Thelephora ganbajun]|uniref:Uncharacterized protein n=1 Tax=Thelephora ganbajun TaxID=370292 RepID=A0ACB6Z5T9_THEGA|nr:hypothetical protein BDM02DRAFT_3190371 [Thelephora ganbajun]